MKTSLLIFSRWLQQVCLSVWIGGMLVLGAIVAPIAFRHSGLTPEQAGSVVGPSLGRLNTLLYVTGALLLLSQAIEWAYRPSDLRWKRWASIRAACTFAMLAIAVYLGGVMFPRMVRDQTAGRMADFRAFHQKYGGWTQAQVFLALGVAFCTAAMATRPTKLARDASGEPEGLKERLES